MVDTNVQAVSFDNRIVAFIQEPHIHDPGVADLRHLLESLFHQIPGFTARHNGGKDRYPQLRIRYERHRIARHERTVAQRQALHDTNALNQGHENTDADDRYIR
jgi:hypothetical protein